MACTEMIVTPVTTDKYYKCVSGVCTEDPTGTFLNDPTCGGTCQKQGAISGTLILAGAALVGMMLFSGNGE